MDALRFDKAALLVLSLSALICGCGGGSGAIQSAAATSGDISTVLPDKKGGHPPSPAPSASPNGALCLSGAQYLISYDDEFTALDPAKYQFQYPWGAANPSSGDDAFYEQSQVSISANGLQFSAQPATAPLPTWNASTLHYLSGMISTYPYLVPQYGYVEASIELPTGRGSFPAFWMLDSYGSGAETDIMEHLDAQPWVQQTLHYVTSPAPASPWQQMDPSGGVTVFHRYAVLWTPLGDTFYVDGVPQVTYTPSVDTVHGDYLMLNLAIGTAGSWPGAPDATTTWPQQMTTRYLRVYQPSGSAC